MSCLMQETLQYGVTRAQESEAVNSHIICEETSKIGFFDDSVLSEHMQGAVKQHCDAAQTP